MNTTINQATATKHDHDVIYAEQLKLLVQSLPLSLLFVVINGGMLAAVQWPVIEHHRVAGWYVALLLVSAVRLYWQRRFSREGDTQRNYPLWGNVFFLGTLLSGIIWGTASYFLFAEHSFPHQVFLAFVLAGTTAGAVTTLAPINRHFQTFALLLLLPLGLRLLQDGDSLGRVMAGMTFLFLCLAAVSAFRVHRTLLLSLNLRFSRARAEEALQESDEQNRLLLESAAEGIFGVDADGITTFVNPAAAVILGYSPDELIGKPIHSAIHYKRPDGSDYPQAYCPMNATLTLGQSNFVEDEVLWHKKGFAIPVEYHSTPIFKNGKISGAVVTFSDVSQRKEAEARLEHQVFYDTLTDLPSRRLLQERLEQTVARSQRHAHMGAVLFLDLDHFKTINDSLGHPVGDELLKKVARRLRETLREEDTAARMGGDEFVLLLPELSDDPELAAKSAQEVAEKIHCHLSSPYKVQEHELHITPSIGIALFPMGGESADDLLKQADTAMYRAKEEGRNAIRFFLPSMQLAAEERLHLYNDLRNALARDELMLHYQPQYDNAGNVAGAEALIRWHHPERGMVSPGDFIPLAEDTGLILPIGQWVLLTACRLISRLEKDWPPGFSGIAVNVSPRQFRQSDFVAGVQSVLQQTGIAPHRLELELTEGILVEDVDDTVSKMNALKGLGVRFSVDDFGTGYSSLAYLHRLPLNKLKVDQSFVQEIGNRGNGDVLVDTIIAMSNHLGLRVIAEGVESEEQFRFLRDKGCGQFQGYFFSRPVAEERFLAILSAGALGQPSPRLRGEGEGLVG